MSFGKLLKEVRESKNHTQQDLADLLGVSRVAIANYELDKNTPTHKNMMKISEVYGVTSDFFTGSEKQVRKVPIIGEASCGLPISSSMQTTGKSCNYNGEFWSSDLYCVIACGDSMSPEIDDGDEIICDPRVSIQHGDIVHYSIHGESAVKIYTVDQEANIIQLVPYNQSNEFKIKTIRIDDDEYQEVKVSKVVSVNKLKFNNRAARLKIIGRS